MQGMLSLLNLVYALIAIMCMVVAVVACFLFLIKRNSLSMLNAGRAISRLLWSGYSCGYMQFIPIAKQGKDYRDQQTLDLRKYIRKDGDYGLEMQLPKKPRKASEIQQIALLELANSQGTVCLCLCMTAMGYALTLDEMFKALQNSFDRPLSK